MFPSPGKKPPPPLQVKFLITHPHSLPLFGKPCIGWVWAWIHLMLGVKVRQNLLSNIFSFVFTFIQCKLIIANIFLLTLFTLSESEGVSNWGIYNQGIKVQVTTKDIKRKTGHSAQRVFLKFNSLFLVLKITSATKLFFAIK